MSEAVQTQGGEAEAPADAPLESGAAALSSLLRSRVLDVDGGAVGGRDLLAAGIVSGRWQRLEAELADGLGLLAAEPLAKAEITEEMRAFRLGRGLISAEDTRAWMAPRGLTMSAVNAAAARAAARRRGGTPARVVLDELAEALVPEAICTGALSEIGWWLADRILSAKATDTEVTPVALESVRVQRLTFAEACAVAGRASPEPAIQRGERIARILSLDDAHRRWEAEVTGDADVARRLRDHELDWCRYEVDELRLTAAGAADEAARQLAEGVPPEALATAAGVPVRRRQVVLVDADAHLQRALTGRIAGEVAGPWQEGEEHVVVRIRARYVPDAGDGEMVARAREELISEACGRLRAGRVRWHEHS